MGNAAQTKDSVMVEFGTIIILNGPSASGKSSIQQEFCNLKPQLWLKMGLDKFFVGVLPPKAISGTFSEDQKLALASLVMEVECSTDEHGFPLATLFIGPLGWKVMLGMHHAIAAYAQQYCYAKELAPNELRAALPFPFTDPFGRYRYASTYGGFLFNNKKHSDLVGMLRECYTRRYLPEVGSKAFDECGNLWEFREGGILRASRGGKLILEAEPISHPGVLCATTGGKQEYLIRFNHDFVKDPRIAVTPKSGLVRRPLTYSQNALLEDEAGYATSYYNDLLHQVTQCEEPLGPITASSPAVPTNQVAQELKFQADTFSSAASIPQQEDALAFSQAIPADQIAQEEGRQATNVLIAPPISQSERLAASTQSTSTRR